MSTGFWEFYPLAIVSQASTETQFQFLLVFAQQVIDLEREGEALYLSGARTHVGVCALSIADAHSVAQPMARLKSTVEVDTDDAMDAQGFDRNAALGPILCKNSDGAQQAQDR